MRSILINRKISYQMVDPKYEWFFLFFIFFYHVSTFLQRNYHFPSQENVGICFCLFVFAFIVLHFGLVWFGLVWKLGLEEEQLMCPAVQRHFGKLSPDQWSE